MRFAYYIARTKSPRVFIYRLLIAVNYIGLRDRLFPRRSPFESNPDVQRARGGNASRRRERNSTRIRETAWWSSQAINMQINNDDCAPRPRARLRQLATAWTPASRRARNASMRARACREIVGPWFIAPADWNRFIITHRSRLLSLGEIPHPARTMLPAPVLHPDICGILIHINFNRIQFPF